MGKYLITGRPGSGKTSVIRELQRRGYSAFNTDDYDDVTKLQEQATGKVVPWPEGPVDWNKYAWNWQEAGLKKLLVSSEDVFIGAIVANQKEYYPLFDTIFALTLSTETLRHRLDSHEHPRTADEKARALAVHEQKQERFMQPGIVTISSEQPIGKVVNEILEFIAR